MSLSVDSGDPLGQRFRDLVSSYAGAMRRLCAVYAGSVPDREDLFQDIFLAIWQALPTFRGEASERTWLYSIAHNVALTWQANDRRLQRRRLSLDQAPAATHAGHEANDALRTGIPTAPVDRQLVSLWLEGLTAIEMGQITGMQPGHVAVRLTRIRQSLSEAFQISEAHNG